MELRSGIGSSVQRQELRQREVIAARGRGVVHRAGFIEAKRLHPHRADLKIGYQPLALGRIDRKHAHRRHRRNELGSRGLGLRSSGPFGFGWRLHQRR